jgi:hypothetical protein
MLLLAAREIGNVNPLREKPVPVTFACEIVIVDPPLFVRVSKLLLVCPT